jgi:hypothetical protein
METTDKPLVRIPHQQLMFIIEVIRHGDKEKAYGKAYPKAAPQSRKPSACRLYNRPEIKQLIDEGRAKATEKAYENATQEATQTMTDELLTLHEKRRELARIVRRQQHMNRYYKFKDHIEVKEVLVDSPSVILRAIELDTRLEAASPQIPVETPPEPLNLLPEPPEGYKGIQMYLDKKADFPGGKDLTDEEYDRLLKLSLTDKRIKLIPPRLTPMLENAGCWVQRDHETGKYSILCPEENIGMLQNENGDYYRDDHMDQEHAGQQTVSSHQGDHNDQEDYGQKTAIGDDHLDQKHRGQVTFINTDTAQDHDNQSIKEKRSMRMICNGVTIYKDR